MSEALIRAQIKTIMESVSGIGVVYDYERHSRSLATKLFLFKSGGIINGWEFSRTKFDPDPETETDASIDWDYSYLISGYYELDDENASEKVFQAIIDGIKNKFADKRTLNGTAITCQPVIGGLIDSDTIDSQGRGDLYHYTHMILVVKDRYMKARA